MSREYEILKSNRPDMQRVEECIKIFDRPSAGDSREMADYIYKLESFVEKHFNQNGYYEGMILPNDEKILRIHDNNKYSILHENSIVTIESEKYIKDIINNF